MSAAAPLTITNGRLVLPTGEPQMGGIRCAVGQIVALGEVSAALLGFVSCQGLP